MRRLFYWLFFQFLKLKERKGGKQLHYDELNRQMDRIPELRKLLPYKDMEYHLVFRALKDTVDEPEILVTQLRLYRIYEFFKNAHREVLDGTVLDVGDSDGTILALLGKGGTSLNINPKSVRFIQARGMRAVLGDAHSIPLPDKSFDYVFCFLTIEHCRDTLAALNEFARIAKKKVFLSAPSGYIAHRYWPRERFINILRSTALKYEADIPINYFDDNTFRSRIFNNRCSSHLRIYVAKPG